MEQNKALRTLQDSEALQKEVAKAAVYLAESNITGTEVKQYAEQLLETFPKMKIQKINEAINFGYTGGFGRTFKLTLQEICVWIRCYESGKMPKDMERSRDEL
jgi:hypothetical protein